MWLLKPEHSYSTVGGGQANTASGAYSFATGRNGVAAYDGSAAFGFQSGVDTTCQSLGEGNVNFCVTAGVTVNGESVALQSQIDSLQSKIDSQIDSLQWQIDSLTKAASIVSDSGASTVVASTPVVLAVACAALVRCFVR